ncbi:hypothetical protein A8709_11420 [Paenibacillus pectinilyticus]|uniref:Alginate O-acetyltransferase n=1 Tax=Paenibacillus pectinilyticus TaxID=512399 RepID=A0A1C1A2L3_9BACL|nr:MBOAT family O-acyltransferase [Paenibacillus pectinilyticus]OCT14774.1 hypothetical protein A8709_11420 [Paenibacillus pectinilyticus]
MMFNTPEFAFLLIVTMILFYAVPKARLSLLTVANVLFYAIVGVKYLLLFGVVSTIVFICARCMKASNKKPLLWLGISVSLLNLIFFKYTAFIFKSVERFLSLTIVPHDAKWLSLALPLGISFYTFELIAYVVDVYKGKIEPEKSIFRFWMFIMFFAHMIAGPIMRGAEFFPQIKKIDTIRFHIGNMRMGVFLISLGLIKKVFISDNLAPYCDSFFAHPEWLNGAEGWTAAVLYAFQIYFDFSGYSDMAVGIGYLFGLNLAVNFLTPYLSGNATEFWRRWHITLSSWIKDYIYIALGGSRHGKFRQYASLFVAMTLSGLWHGSKWTFVAWGMYQGGLLIGHKLWSTVLNKLGLKNRDNYWWYRLANMIGFFALTCLGWVLFRVESLTYALALMKRMLTFPEAFIFPAWVKHFWIVILFMVILHVIEHLLLKHMKDISMRWHRWFPTPVRGAVYTLFVVLLILLYKHEQSTFIYFQF